MKKSVIIFGVVLFIGCLQSEAYSQKVEVEQVFHCEDTVARLDAVANNLEEDNENVKKVIFIARLGKKETDLYLSARRLFAVRKYLISQGVKSDKIIGAFGEKTEGLGRIEIYLNGYMFEIIILGHRKDLPVGYCDIEEFDRKMYQLLKNKRTRKKMKKKYGRFL